MWGLPMPACPRSSVWFVATRKLVRNGFWEVHQIGNDARKSVSSATLES